MEFKDKLNFLLDITHVESKEVADYIGVNPSMISLLKTGRRKKLSKDTQTKRLADYFAQECKSTYQRKALSEATGCPNLEYNIQASEISNFLYLWLTDTPLPNSAGQLMQYVDNQPNLLNQYPHLPPLTGQALDFPTIYFEREEKKNALRTFFKHVLSLEEPRTLYVQMEENPIWFTSDSSFMREINGYISTLLNRGFEILEILPPDASSGLFYEMTIQRVTGYLSGYLKAYYYPRFRDCLYRHSSLIIPGEIIYSSQSFAWQTEPAFVVVTTSPSFVEANFRQMQEYLSRCEPAFTIGEDKESIIAQLKDYMSHPIAQAKRGNGLSLGTMPISLLDYIISNSQDSLSQEIAELVKERKLSNHFNHSECIDICPLANASEIKIGRVPIPFPRVSDCAPLYYTSELYIEHLREILHLLATEPNYHFVPVPYTGEGPHILLVKRGQCAILFNTNSPALSIKISLPEMINSFYEHLNSVAEPQNYIGIGRKRIVDQINRLIQDLEK